MVFDHELDEDKPIHHRDVHIAVALIAIAATTIVGSVPVMMFAQETIAPPPQEQPQQPLPPPQPMFDLGQCNAKCEELKTSCLAQLPPDDPTAGEKCSSAVGQCLTACTQQSQQSGFPNQGAPMPPGGFQPGQGGFQPQGGFPQQGGFQPGQGGFPQQQGFQPGQGGFPQQGGFQPGQPGQPGGQMNFGPDEEQMKKMQEQGLKQMKQAMTRFKSQLAKMKKRVAQVEAKGITVPADLKTAIATATDLMAKVESAETFDDVSEIGEELRGAGETIGEQMPNLERLANLSTIYRRIDTEIKKLDRMLVSDKALAKRSKVDLSAAVADFENALAEIKTAYANAKAKIAAGEVEDGFGILEDNVFGGFDEVREFHDAIVQIGRLQTTLKQIDRELAQQQTTLNRLKKKKLDTADAQKILDEGKAKSAELKTLAAAKPFNSEAVFDALGELADLRDAFMEAINELQGITETAEVDTGFKQQKYVVPDFGEIPGFGPQEPQGPQGITNPPLGAPTGPQFGF